MITDFLFGGLIGMVNFLFSLIPSWNMPDLTSVETSIYNNMESANRVFPVDTLIYVLLAAIAVKILLASWDLLVFAYHQIWGSD